MKIIINIEKKHFLIITLILVISTITFVLAESHGVSHHAAEITQGIFDVARIPDLSASKITSGEFAKERIPTTLRSTTISGNLVVTGNTDLNCQIIDALNPISCDNKCTSNSKICLFGENMGGSYLIACNEGSVGDKRCLCC